MPEECDAQRRRKKKKRRDKDKVEEVSRSTQIFDKMWVGINIGNPNVNNRFFSIGLGPMAAYKFNDFLSAGIVTDINYLYSWSPSSSQRYVDYSYGVFSRAKFFQQFYAHLEFNYTSLDSPRISNQRENFPVLFIGGGYTSGRPPWGFEATLLIDAMGNLSQFRIPFVYRLGVTYAF